MKICVLIPSFNEAETIGRIVGAIKSKGLDVLVIDDGSSDSTAKIAAREGALVTSHVKNLGKGASIKEGFNFILKTTNFDSVIIMDGDGQHPVEDIDKFIKYAEEHDYDIIVGNRMKETKSMPLIRLITNKFMSIIISSICKHNIPDTQCGFRFLRRSALDKLELESTKYDTDSEMLIDASRKGLKIASIPVETIYGGEKSTIHPVKDTLRFISLLIKSYFKK